MDQVDLHQLGIAVLYGMYLLARSGGSSLREVTYRYALSWRRSLNITTTISSATLFEAVRDQYEVSG